MKTLLTFLFSSIFLLIQVHSQTFEASYFGHYRSLTNSFDQNYVLSGNIPEGENELISLLRVDKFSAEKIIEFKYGIDGFQFTSNFIFETKDTSFFICGQTTLDGAEGDPIILMVDKCGNPKWMRNLKNIFCPEAGITMNWVNNATLDQNGNLTVMIGFYPCTDYIINFDKSGNINWYNIIDDVFEESYIGGNMISGIDNGYLISGAYLGYRDTIPREFDYAAALIKLDSLGVFEWKKYYVHTNYSQTYSSCIAWNNQDYLSSIHSGFLGNGILRNNSIGDSISYALPFDSLTYNFIGQQMFKAEQGEYFIVGESFATEVASDGKYGVQLINEDAELLAYNKTIHDEYISFRDAIVTNNAELIVVGDYIESDGDFSLYDDIANTYLVKFDSELNFATKDTAVTSEFVLQDACDLDANSIYFDLSILLEEYYSYLLTDSLIEDPIGELRNDFEGRVLTFPNPFYNTVTFRLQKDINVDQISIFDARGSLVEIIYNTGHDQVINYSNSELIPGIYYFIASFNGDFQASGKIIAE